MKIQYQKLLGISLLMILTVYVHGMCTAAKDAIILFNLGAEVISALKLYGTLPLVILIMLHYPKLLKIFNYTTLYHSTIIISVIFFLVFIFVLYPNHQNLHIDQNTESIIHLKTEYEYFKYIIELISNWTFSLFYILAEIYGNIILVVFFWQLANQITETTEAKRFYPFLILIGQIGMLFSGQSAQLFSEITTHNNFQVVEFMIIAICVASLCMSLNFLYLSNFVIGKSVINQAKRVMNSENTSLMKNSTQIKLIFSSKYTAFILLMIICYGFSINVTEIIWKKSICSIYETQIDYSNFIGQIQTYTAIVSILFMIFNIYLMPMISWKASALITPIAILITSAPFLFLVIYSQFRDIEYEETMSILPYAILILGAIQNIISKSCIAFFDPAKEICFIPLNEPVRSISKSFDMIASRVGKASSSIAVWVMLSFIPNSNLFIITPNLGILLFILLFAWIFIVIGLAKEFDSKLHTTKQFPSPKT